MKNLLKKIEPTHVIIFLLATLALFQFLLLHEKKNSDDQKQEASNAHISAQCDYEGGIKKSLPDSIMLIHKFGEAGDERTKEFHESGIVYAHNNSYLLAIMTKGKNMEKLPRGQQTFQIDFRQHGCAIKIIS